MWLTGLKVPTNSTSSATGYHSYNPDSDPIEKHERERKRERETDINTCVLLAVCHDGAMCLYVPRCGTCAMWCVCVCLCVCVLISSIDEWTKLLLTSMVHTQCVLVCLGDGWAHHKCPLLMVAVLVLFKTWVFFPCRQQL